MNHVLNGMMEFDGQHTIVHFSFPATLKPHHTYEGPKENKQWISFVYAYSAKRTAGGMRKAQKQREKTTTLVMVVRASRATLDDVFFSSSPHIFGAFMGR